MRGRLHSFKGHEFQVDIINSVHPNAVVKKPSQMGLTEAEIRFALAFLMSEKDSCCMYLLPTVGEALRMAKSRFDPVIAASGAIKNALVSGSDSSSFKQLGSSQLHMGGTFGREVVSVPVDLLVIDEYDFCDFTNATTAESRLTHSEFKTDVNGTIIRGLKRKFSTPTALGIGVDLLFSQSDQKYRLVKCKSCHDWFWPNFLENVVVDGYDGSFQELDWITALSLDDRGLIPSARIICPHCHKTVHHENLQPEYREWVAKHPHVRHQEGWQVSPFDAPEYHTPASILRKLIDYQTKVAKFNNYVLGFGYSDSTNSIIDSVVEANTTLSPILPEQAEHDRLSGCIAGLDIGKTSWLLIGRYDFSKKAPIIIHAEAIKLRDPNGSDLETIVLERLRQYGVTLLVCDMLPYTDTILKIQAKRPEGWVLPNSYTLGDKKLPIYEVDENRNIIASNRTKSLDYTAKMTNSGAIKFCKSPEMATVRKHLQGMKKIDPPEERAEEPSRWVKSSDDHYFHALNYLCLASMITETTGLPFAPVPSIRQATVGSKFNGNKPTSQT